MARLGGFAPFGVGDFFGLPAVGEDGVWWGEGAEEFLEEEGVGVDEAHELGMSGYGL